MSDSREDIKGTFSFVSLGCPKNLVDSERMLGLLAQDGYVLVPEGPSSFAKMTIAGLESHPLMELAKTF